MIRTTLVLPAAVAASLLACAHGPEAPQADDPAATQPGEPPIREGDSLAAVRRKLGDGADVRTLSPTEKVLSAMYPAACRDVPAAPGDLSRTPCGAGRLLTVRVRDDRVVSLEWGEPAAATPAPEVTAPAEPR